MIAPVKPEEVEFNIPDFVIETVNALIREKWNGEEAVIYQDEIMARISSNDPDDNKPSRKTVYDMHWLDFEPLYRKVGWNVLFDKPGFNENYKAYFKFTTRKY